MPSYFVSYASPYGVGGNNITTLKPLAPGDMKTVAEEIKKSMGISEIVILSIFKYEDEAQE